MEGSSVVRLRSRASFLAVGAAALAGAWPVAAVCVASSAYGQTLSAEVPIAPETYPSDQRLAAISFDSLGLVLIVRDPALAPAAPNVGIAHFTGTTRDWFLTGSAGFLSLATDRPDAVSWGEATFVAWGNEGGGGEAAYSIYLPDAGTLAREVTIPSASSCYSPSASADDAGYFLGVACNNGGGVYSGRWSQIGAGGALQTSGSLGDPDGGQLDVAVAFDGEVHLFAWQEYLTDGNIFLRRMDPSGAWVDPSAVPVADAGPGRQRPTVAATGGFWLVAWVDGSTGALMARRFDASLQAVDDSPWTLAAPAGAPQEPRLLALPEGTFLSVWTQAVDGGFGIQGVRIRTDGTFADPSPFVLTGPGQSVLTPKVTALAGPSDFAVSYSVLDADAGVYRSFFRLVDLPGVTTLDAGGLSGDGGADGGTDSGAGGDGGVRVGPLALRVGCDCGAAGVSAEVVLLALALVLVSARRTRRAAAPRPQGPHGLERAAMNMSVR